MVETVMETKQIEIGKKLILNLSCSACKIADGTNVDYTITSIYFRWLFLCCAGELPIMRLNVLLK